MNRKLLVELEKQRRRLNNFFMVVLRMRAPVYRVPVFKLKQNFRNFQHLVVIR